MDLQLNVINCFLAMEYQLVFAYLIDEDQMRIDLPPEAFDGQLMQEAIESPQADYQ